MSLLTRLIIIALVLIGAAWQLWPTYRYSQVNDEREALVADTANNPAGILALQRWDSLNYDDWLSYREKRIKLGLDLRGGVYFTMEVDIPALLRESATPDLVDDTFTKVMDAVDAEARLSEDPVLDIFKQKFAEIAAPQGKTLSDYYELGELTEDEEILAKLQNNIDDAVNRAEEVIRQRIDKYGVSETSLQKQGTRRIIIEMPDEQDPSRVRDLLSRTARLEFKLVRNDADIIDAFRAIDELVRGEVPTKGGDEEKKDNTDVDTVIRPDSTPSGDTTGRPAGDTAGDANDTTAPTNTSDTANDPNDTTDDSIDNPYEGLDPDGQQKKYLALHPFTSLFETVLQADRDAQRQPASGVFDMPTSPQAEYSFYLPKKNIAKLQSFLNRPDVRALIPEDRQIALSAHGAGDEGPEQVYEIFVLKGEAELTGEYVVDASPNMNEQGQPVVNMAMDVTGAEIWSELTGTNVKKRVAVVLDSSVYSAPWISEQISGGHTQITGSADPKEAELLSTILKSGALKAPIKIIEERVVGPSLGADQIDQGITAVLIASLLVILFMVMYYVTGGIVADLAVALNVFITLAALAAFQGTLTLPGIGALVLTIGMAVDANILIYERIREELALGKGLAKAVEEGYARAFTAIIDTHITTILTGVILAALGSGPIRGFAIMLVIGILATLFTAVFFTRSIFMFMLERGVSKINFGQPKARTV